MCFKNMHAIVGFVALILVGTTLGLPDWFIAKRGRNSFLKLGLFGFSRDGTVELDLTYQGPIGRYFSKLLLLLKT